MSLPSASAAAPSSPPTHPAPTTSVRVTPIVDKREPLVVVESEFVSARGSGASTPTVSVGTGQLSVDRTLSPEMSCIERARLEAKPIDAQYRSQNRNAVRPVHTSTLKQLRASLVLDYKRPKQPEERVQHEVKRQQLIGACAARFSFCPTL